MNAARIFDNRDYGGRLGGWGDTIVQLLSSAGSQMELLESQLSGTIEKRRERAATA